MKASMYVCVCMNYVIGDFFPTWGKNKKKNYEGGQTLGRCCGISILVSIQNLTEYDPQESHQSWLGF